MESWLRIQMLQPRFDLTLIPSSSVCIYNVCQSSSKSLWRPCNVKNNLRSEKWIHPIVYACIHILTYGHIHGIYFLDTWMQPSNMDASMYYPWICPIVCGCIHVVTYGCTQYIYFWTSGCNQATWMHPCILLHWAFGCIQDFSFWTMDLSMSCNTHLRPPWPDPPPWALLYGWVNWPKRGSN